MKGALHVMMFMMLSQGWEMDAALLVIVCSL